MTDRVFLSYLREDADRIDQLARILESAGIPVWIDRFEIRAGEDWLISTRQAVATAPFFMACLSARMQARERSIMWEELRVAVEEARTRPTDRPWLIPVKLEPCDVPAMPLYGHRTLRDLQYVELYPDFEAGARELIDVLTGKRKFPATVPFAPEADVNRNKFKDVKARRINIDNVKGETPTGSRPAHMSTEFDGPTQTDVLTITNRNNTGKS